MAEDVRGCRIILVRVVNYILGKETKTFGFYFRAKYTRYVNFLIFFLYFVSLPYSYYILPCRLSIALVLAITSVFVCPDDCW